MSWHIGQREGRGSQVAVIFIEYNKDKQIIQ